ncbi:uncharacterized protein LOC108680268 [Hyalella azteca]|uniref:Uncharacterized protein LOC108680268 n=1 Tax=Hyalella azteca TaxID=294128 RepID=A0A8B7PGW9_HYAAZ|nr:uncharacterized protein LOC108680268 [Hyalella azteca]
MTDEDRAYRKQWLQDQILAESEPIEIPGYYEARYNPIRRAIMWPLNQVFKPINPRLGPQRAHFWRYLVGKGFMGIYFALGTIYYFKYNANDWTTGSGWRVYVSRTRQLPGHPDYGKPSPRQHPSDFADFGFKNSPI